jgi:hypothetical protein
MLVFSVPSMATAGWMGGHSQATVVLENTYTQTLTDHAGSPPLIPASMLYPLTMHTFHAGKVSYIQCMLQQSVAQQTITLCNAVSS